MKHKVRITIDFEKELPDDYEDPEFFLTEHWCINNFMIAAMKDEGSCYCYNVISKEYLGKEDSDA